MRPDEFCAAAEAALRVVWKPLLTGLACAVVWRMIGRMI